MPAVASHPGVDKVAFTGSTATGRAVARAAAENPRHRRVPGRKGGLGRAHRRHPRPLHPRLTPVSWGPTSGCSCETRPLPTPSSRWPTAGNRRSTRRRDVPCWPGHDWSE
ncbi:MAG TPA: aldehyde dehydrogenase family protein [Streptosporangiaceae bacterium]|nr:aldehyde dehydrogenase family protein [Streptosporangiaceae bacterium]HEX2823371.1 aldehyde dehydrogenase family protein [Streptosporangiaceae bacterium]